MSIPPNNFRRNLRISVMRDRKCTIKGCNNIVLFNLYKYNDYKFCFKHNNIHLYNKIETLEKGYYIIKNKYIIPKKKICYSISYYNKLIDITKKIIYYRKIYFKQKNGKNIRGYFSYRFVDIIFGYQYFLNILLTYKKSMNKSSLMNNGVKLSCIKIKGNNYIKYDANYHFRSNFLNNVDSLEEFQSDLHIVSYEKDIIKIKMNIEKYFFELFKKNYKYELSIISVDSFNIIKDYYYTNEVFDDFNKGYLRKKKLNNQFLRNIIILSNRCKTKVYFFHK